MLNQFRDIHSNSVLLEFIGKKGEGDSIVSGILSSKWQANGKTGSSWFWFKQDRTLVAILPNPPHSFQSQTWTLTTGLVVRATHKCATESQVIPLPELAGWQNSLNSLWGKEFGNLWWKGRSKFVNKTYLLIMLPFILPNTWKVNLILPNTSYSSFWLLCCNRLKQSV